MPIERCFILGVPVDNVNMADALRYAKDVIQSNSRSAIIAVNPEKVMAAVKDPMLGACLHEAGLVLPDGVGVVLAARMRGSSMKGRVPGSELMPLLCEMAASSGYGVYLYGAAEEVNALAAAALKKKYPALQIVGRQHGFLSSDVRNTLVESINSSGAKILFVALGSPRQELWIRAHLGMLNVNVVQGVGGTFDVIAGRVKRAPRAFIKLNLEWLYRLLADPRRVARQKVLPIFTVKVILEAFSMARVKK